MGNIEKAAKKKRRSRALRGAVLLSVGAAGLIAAAAVAPNAVQLLEYAGINAKLRYRTMSVLGRLKSKGEIEFEERDGIRFVRLTPKGEAAVALLREKMSLAEKKPRRWDGRYRLVMFDIPEKRKKMREQLRLAMREVGFLRVQDSAWIYPYDCEEFVALIKADLQAGKNVLYAVVEEIENDGWIRRHFELPAK